MVVLRLFGLLFSVALAGHLFYRAFAPPEEEVSLSEALFVQGFAGFLLCGWLALLLAEFGLFSLPLLVLLLLIGSAIVAAARWSRIRRWRWPRPRLSPKVIGSFGLVLGLAGVLLYPGEWVLGGQDPAVYLSTGALIARTGTIVFQEPWIADLPPETHSLLLSSYAGQWGLFPGLHVTDFTTGEITPQFLHLYPTWIALFYAAAGLPFALAATPLIALLGLAALSMLLRRIFGEWVTLVALALLALNPAQVWFSRQPAAEILILPLLFGGWYLLDRAMAQPHRHDLAILAGLALGQIALTKIELLILPLLIYGYFWLRSAAIPLQPSEKSFLITLTLLVVHGAIHMALIAHPYLQTFVISLRDARLPKLALPLLGLSVCLGLGLLYAFRRRIGQLLTGQGKQDQILRSGLVALWLLLVVYGAVLRPGLSPAEIEIQGQWYANIDRLSFLRLAWYLSPIGLGLAVVGMLWWLWKRLTGPALPFLIAFFLYLLFYTYRAMVYPYHFWMVRRYIPLIFPCLTVGVAVALWRVRRAPLGRAVRRGGAMLLVGLLIFQSVQADAPFASRRELAGTVQTLDHLADQIPDDKPLLIEHFGVALALPLRCIYGKRAFAIAPSVPFGQEQLKPQREPFRWEDFWLLLEEWPPHMDTAYLLLEGMAPTLRGGFSLVEIGNLDLETWQTERSYARLPRDAGLVRSSQRLFRLQRSPDALTELEVSLAKPLWTEACIAVDLPPPTTPLRLRLQVAGFRPDPVPPTHLTITWAGEAVNDLALERSLRMHEITVDLPLVATGSTVRLELCSETWNPKAVGYNNDPRNLGILLQSLILESAPPAR
jgi:hypothetical protein